MCSIQLNTRITFWKDCLKVKKLIASAFIMLRCIKRKQIFGNISSLMILFRLSSIKLCQLAKGTYLRMSIRLFSTSIQIVRCSKFGPFCFKKPCCSRVLKIDINFKINTKVFVGNLFLLFIASDSKILFPSKKFYK